jgi:putative transposase
LFGYIGGIINSLGQKTIIVNGFRNHVHLFFEFKPVTNLSELIKKIKSNSSRYMNEKGYSLGRFEWQKGYSAFSYSQSQIDDVFEYIQNQEKHHRKRTFKEEYIGFLKKYNVPYDERYLFEWIE